MSEQLTGFPRPNGSWGVRNHVLVLPARAAANRAAEEIASAVSGTVAVTHEWEGVPGDPDHALVERTLAGFAANPNVAAVLLVTVIRADEELAEAISARGQRVERLAMSAHGGTAGTILAGRTMAAHLASEAAAQQREPMPWSALAIGLECGGSDALSGITANPALGVASDRLVAAGATTMLSEVPELVGAEEILAARAITPAVGARMIKTIHDFERSVEALGVDIRGAQPTPGNIEGGLTTIEEKSLGAAKKAGNAPLTGVVDFAQTPTVPGLYVMDTPGHDIEQMVGLVAGGCQIVAFTTGRGTPTGSAIAPCLKISTNTAIFERMAGDIDLDAGRILDGSHTLQSMGDAIHAALLSAANGEQTASEQRGNREFAIRRTRYDRRVGLHVA
ncbi:UxaA family hydrolase [Conexibacter sp. CPCC 206217]|uniref:UxaA family hydrolase n=1 Tax=Conexibacter sp. CPCC 206217 TaxID=3064574 RepID=UPI00271712C6|nr:UxaA family hydrolase [Conexibacter sp. CPCC 206217]MDO8211151.1 UxaA family hydrolase [Conexibacter sp. CPCC 206217]